jgi:hypothetical protein
VRNLDGVRVGGSCGDFAPTLQAVFGLAGLRDHVPRGREHVRRELEDAARFNGFSEREAALLVALADEVPPGGYAMPRYPKGDPVLVFDTAAAKGRAVRHLDAAGVTGFRGQRGLALAFADVPTLARAVTSLVLEGNIRQFHLAAPEDD